MAFQVIRESTVDERRMQGRKNWVCICDCGTQFVSWKIKRISSCGCASNGGALRHGAKSRLNPTTHRKAYTAWCNMRKRCDQPNTPDFQNWGGRGIKYCERWQSFENFLADMGDPPENTSLDRKNNDGNYEPTNCRWATKEEQARNSRQVRLITHNGKTMMMREWAKEIGISIAQLSTRFKKGMSVEQALHSGRYPPIAKSRRRT